LRESSDEPGGRRNASASKGIKGLQKEVTFNEMQLPEMEADDEDEEEDEEEFTEDPMKKIFNSY
jgi:hypothetical protein